jgi:Notch-like protein
MYKECYDYKWLTERGRNKNSASNKTRYGDGKLNGWYRFGGGAGTKISTTCVTVSHCGGTGAGWMNGTHPTVAEGKVTRKVCYSANKQNCCWRIAISDIEVSNCGHYYVYKLKSAGCLPCRYCGTY